MNGENMQLIIALSLTAANILGLLYYYLRIAK